MLDDADREARPRDRRVAMLVEVAHEPRRTEAELDPQPVVEELADILARQLVQKRDRGAVAVLQLWCPPR